MKKLMLALVVAAVAVASQAATIKWNSGTIYNQAGTKANAGTALVTAYLYNLTADQYTAVAAMDAATIYDTYVKGATAANAPGQKTGSLGTANITQTVAGGSTESPVTYYGLVVYVDELSAASDPNTLAYIKSAAQAATFKDDGTISFSSLASGQASWSSVQSVPEPTSGLLLLLGMAGLALKRKHA